MTGFAGVFSTRTVPAIPDVLRDRIRQLLSRRDGESLAEFGDQRCYLVKFDIGAYGAPAFLRDPEGGISAMAGEPLLESNEVKANRSRADDLRSIHEALKADDPGALKTARGCFCVVSYDPAKRRLSLVADKLGLRPIYVAAVPGFVIFSTALRVLEELESVPKIMDLRAVSELAAFRCCLGRRTPYAGIRRIDGGQIVSFAPDKTTDAHYWNWRTFDRRMAGIDAEGVVEEAYRVFIDAVSVRLRSGERSVAAFLSGGLDSRAIVTALRDRSLTVHTFNFSDEDTLDRILGAQYAAAAGTVHYMSQEGAPNFANASSLQRRFVFEERPELASAIDRPQLAWAGDGGSVCTGFVYLSENLAEPARGGDLETATRRFLRFNNIALPRRYLNKALSSELAQLPEQSMLEEMSNCECADSAKLFYLFLLMNDQRHHLDDHFENMDIHRTELHLPFFDSRFVETMFSVPFEYGVYHRFYHDWLGRFPAVAASVPWQTYPGHLPCPLPLPPAVYQWSAEFRRAGRVRSAVTHDFPSSIFDRKMVAAAKLAASFGRQDLGYLFETSKLYARYLGRCDGKYVLVGRGFQ